MQMTESNEKQEIQEINEELTSALKNFVMKIIFEKKDGTKRTMYATLQDKYLPPLDESKKVQKDKPKNYDFISCWDTEKEGWRSFRIDSIIEVEKTFL